MSGIGGVFLIALLMLVGGLAVCLMSHAGGKAAALFWWIGIVVAVCGALLILAPVIVFIANMLKQALGA